MYSYTNEDILIDLNVPTSQQWMLAKAINAHRDLINKKINEVLDDFKVTLDSLDKVTICFNWIDLEKDYESFETSNGNCVVLILISWTKDKIPGNMAVKLRFKLLNRKLILI